MFFFVKKECKIKCTKVKQFDVQAEILPLPKSHRRCSPTCPAPLGCGPGKNAFLISHNFCTISYSELFICPESFGCGAQTMAMPTNKSFH